MVHQQLFRCPGDNPESGADTPGPPMWPQDAGHADVQSSCNGQRVFARENSRNICKGFTPHVWQKEGQMSVAITETFELASNQLPSDEVLTYAPAIYQERVPKEYDIRMVLMGNHIYSYALKNK